MKRCALACAGLLALLSAVGCRNERPQEPPTTFDESTHAPASALTVGEDENLLTPPGRLPELPGSPDQTSETEGTGETNADTEEGDSGETE